MSLSQRIADDACRYLEKTDDLARASAVAADAMTDLLINGYIDHARQVADHFFAARFRLAPDVWGGKDR